MDAHGAVPYHQNKKIMKSVFDYFIGFRMLRDAKLLVAETEVGKQEYLDILPSLDPDRIAILSPPFDTDEYIELPQSALFR